VDLGPVAVLPVLALPCAGPKPSLDVDLAAFPELRSTDLGRASEGDDIVPFRVSRPLSRLVLVPLVSRDPEDTDRCLLRGRPKLRISSQIAKQRNPVHAHDAPPVEVYRGEP